MNSTKLLTIGFLEGKQNWSKWNYETSTCLRGIPGALDTVEGRLIKPIKLADNATVQQKEVPRIELDRYLKAGSNALIVLTTDMKEGNLQKIMHLIISWEVWIKLHKCFDGIFEVKVYDLCSFFFGFKKNSGDDIATHIAKRNNLWNELKQGMMI